MITMVQSFWSLTLRLCVATFLVLAICAVSVPAQEGVVPQERNTLFFRANNSYKEERYDAAIEDYEQLISSGLRSANTFYNLGNAYLRMGNRGKAILSYERAFRMRPRDADIRSNLSFARTLVEGSAGQYRRQWYQRVFLFLCGFLSVDEMTSLVSCLYFATAALFVLSILLKAQRKPFLYSAAVLLALLAIVLPSFISSIREFEFQKKVVIMAKEIGVRFEPNDDATVHFELYEGAVIQITRTQEGWQQVRRHDGKMGWMKGEVFVVI